MLQHLFLHCIRIPWHNIIINKATTLNANLINFNYNNKSLHRMIRFLDQVDKTAETMKWSKGWCSVNSSFWFEMELFEIYILVFFIYKSEIMKSLHYSSLIFAFDIWGWSRVRYFSVVFIILSYGYTLNYF